MKNPGKTRWLIPALLVLITIAMAYLIHYYGQDFKLALFDCGLHILLVIIALLLLENIFRFYLPQKSNLWLALTLPFLFSAVVLFSGDVILKNFLDNHSTYKVFLNHSLAIRGVFIFLLFSASAVILVMGGKLEDQLKRRKNEEMIKELSKEAELYHLRQQLQPHFLFNCLNSIHALIPSNPEKAREMVLQLSEFLRGTIRKEDKKWVKAEEETAYLQMFLDIERVRFGHRLKVDFGMGESAKNCIIPPLLIQPLVENAIKHGLYGISGEVSIMVDIQKRAEYLEIFISNPFDPAAGQLTGEGFGLAATKRRLYLLFGRHDLLNCTRLDQQFSVSLKIPQPYDQNNNY